MSLDLPSFSACDALVAVMVAVSASDQQLRTAELVAIERIVNHTPAFADYEITRIRAVSQTVMTLFDQEDGLDMLFGLIRDALPERMYDTAYVLACDVASADGRVTENELRLLTELRDELELDRLHAAAIELAAKARHRRL